MKKFASDFGKGIDNEVSLKQWSIAINRKHELVDKIQFKKFSTRFLPKRFLDPTSNSTKTLCFGYAV